MTALSQIQSAHADQARAAQKMAAAVIAACAEVSTGDPYAIRDMAVVLRDAADLLDRAAMAALVRAKVSQKGQTNGHS